MSMNWDEYFYHICISVGGNSKCLSRHIGAILVKDKSIISTGYNGPPRGVPSCNNRAVNERNIVGDNFLYDHFKEKGIDPKKVQRDKQCPRYALGFKSGEGLEWCVAGHAERNTLINAARLGIATKGSIMYMDCGIPCTPCLVEIINAGVEEIVVTKMEYYDMSGKWLVNKSNLKVREFVL